jgi:hypothetical protein
MESILNVLVRRDKMTLVEARRELEDMRERVLDGEDPEEILYEIGLEPDYIFDLID